MCISLLQTVEMLPFEKWRHLLALLAILVSMITILVNPIEANYIERKSIINGKGIFTNSFLVRFHQPVEHDFAKEVAQKYGFESLGAVSKEEPSILSWSFGLVQELNDILYDFVCTVL